MIENDSYELAEDYGSPHRNYPMSVTGGGRRSLAASPSAMSLGLSPSSQRKYGTSKSVAKH